MTTPASYIPVSIDYTGRDYYAIREQLIARVQDRIPSWTGTNEADFGIALVEAFAYLGDLISYYIDRNANEAFISTATQRDSVINLAETYGYTPAGYRSANVQLTFTNTESTSTADVTSASGNGTSITFVGSNSFALGALVSVVGFTTTQFNVTNATLTAVTPNTFTVSSSYSGTSGGSESGTATMTPVAISIPKGTVVSGEVTSGDTVQTVYFSTTANASADPSVNNGVVTVGAVEGQSVVNVSADANAYGELVGYGDITSAPNQFYQLGQNPAADDSPETPFTVYVQDVNDTYSKWTKVSHLIDYGPYDQVFSTYTDSSNNVYILFGNGISGLIPVPSAEIRVLYTVGGGTIGNVLAQTLNTIVHVPGLTSNQLTFFQSAITVNHQTNATGGNDPEPIEQIRLFAPLYLRANTRAVTLEDFNSLAYGAGAGKANAVAGNNWTSVTLYLAPTTALNDPDISPGLNSDSSPSTTYVNLAATVLAAIQPNMMIGATLTPQPPTYVDVILAIQYTPNPQYTTTEAETAIKSMIVNTYGYNQMNFGDVIHQQDIEYSLNNLPELKVGKVTALHRQGESGLNILTADPSEIFRFQESNISIGTI